MSHICGGSIPGYMHTNTHTHLVNMETANTGGACINSGPHAPLPCPLVLLKSLLEKRFFLLQVTRSIQSLAQCGQAVGSPNA